MPAQQNATQIAFANSEPVSGSSVALPWWLQAIVLLGAFLMAAGAFIAILNPAMLVAPHSEINAAVRIYAGYLFSRNLVLAILLVASLGFRARATLNTLILLTALIQWMDAAVDCVEGRWAIVPGVVIFGLLFLLAATKLSRHPFWRKQAWSVIP